MAKQQKLRKEPTTIEIPLAAIHEAIDWRLECAVVHAEKSALRFDSNAEAANSYYNAARAVAALVAPVYEPDGWPNFSKWYDMLKTARDSISA